MSSIRRTINTLTNLKVLSGVFFDTALTALQSENGLSNDNIESLLSFITDDKLEKCRAGGFRDIIYCCIPDASLSSDVIDIALLWMFYKVRCDTVVSSKLNAVLEWISGLLEFNLIDKAHVDGYYELFYQVLRREQCQSLACKVIHMLTRPEDVSRVRVENIVKLYKKTGGRGKHLAHLIELFKTYKPELVPETVRSYSRETAFKSLAPGFKRMLEVAQERFQAQNNQLQTKSCGLDWTAVTTKTSKSAMPLIPTAMYVHLGSELYREKRRKVVDFMDKLSLASYHLTCELPSSILSLMLNEGGMHLLVAHNSDVHARFSSLLYSCLHSVFILNNKNVPYEEREHFLKQLVILEDYMQQGIPVVSRFLALYIWKWNGYDHQRHIYRLLERITFSTYAEFHDCIHVQLYTLFLSAQVEEKVIIINTYSEMLFNMYVKWGKQLPKEHLFLGHKQEWETNYVTVVPQLIQAITNLCEVGIFATPDDASILHASLSFFETLVDLQAGVNHTLTVVPPAIFYRCLFSLDFCSLARACALLMRYKDFCEDPQGSESLGSDNVTLLNKYSCDVWNCLVNKKAFTKSSQGYILTNHGKLKQQLTIDPDSAFSVENHITMLGIAQHMQQIDPSSGVVLTEEELQNALAVGFPELGECLKALQAKYLEYHTGKN